MSSANLQGLPDDENDSDVLISRLMQRIAELEEQKYTQGTGVNNDAAWDGPSIGAHAMELIQKLGELWNGATRCVGSSIDVLFSLMCTAQPHPSAALQTAPKLGI